MKYINTIIFCTLYALLNVSGAAIIKSLLKQQVLSDFNSWFNFLFDFKVAGAFLLIFLSALVMFKALGSGNFSVVVPIATGINFILTIIAGYFLFKEQINIISLIGFALILLGIVLLTVNANQHAH